MFAAFLASTFRRFGANLDSPSGRDGGSSACAGTIQQAIEHVVDETAPRLRAVPGYARRLRGPVIAALRTIDRLVKEIPGVLDCRRSNYASDPRVNAFFVDYGELQEVFSRSQEVRELFEANADAEQCFALLCMHRSERCQLGVALDGDMLRRDEIQTTVSFADHQLDAPGLDEADARCALKCCIFNSLIGHIRKSSAEAQTRIDELERRSQAWRERLKRQTPGSAQHAALQREVEAIDAELRTPALRLTTLEQHFRYVADALANPQALVSGHQESIFLDRMGIKHDRATAGVREIPLSEIHVADRRPRVACLVSFPRAELLSVRDFIREAGIYLAA